MIINKKKCLGKCSDNREVRVFGETAKSAWPQQRKRRVKKRLTGGQNMSAFVGSVLKAMEKPLKLKAGDE